MSFKNRWLEPTSREARKKYRLLRKELRASRTTKERRDAIVALLDSLAKNPEPLRSGFTAEVAELYGRLTRKDVEDAQRHFHALDATSQQSLRESVVRLAAGEFQAWFATQFWLKQHGQPSALDGGNDGEPALA